MPLKGFGGNGIANRFIFIQLKTLIKILAVVFPIALHGQLENRVTEKIIYTVRFEQQIQNGAGILLSFG